MEYARNQRILFASSNSLQQKIIAGVLERARYQVVIADSSDDAMDMLESSSSSYGLVIADTSLPGLGGLDVIRVLRYLDREHRVKAIVRTEDICEQVEVASLAAGADELLPIPIEEDMLLAVVRRLLPPVIEQARTALA